jgi:hypothetical protein
MPQITHDCVQSGEFRPHKNRRSGKHIDPQREAALMRDFSSIVAVSSTADLPAIKVLILDKMDAWEIGAVSAFRLLCEIEQKLRPGHRMSRVTRDGEIVPMDLL